MTMLTRLRRDGRGMRRGRAAIRPRPSCEALEGRQLLATLTWVGTADGAVFSAAANWTPPQVPQANDTLQFNLNTVNSPAPNTPVDKSPNNDIAADTPFSLSFGTSGYVLGGNEISISGTSAIDAINPSGSNEVALPLLVAADSTIAVAAPATLQVDTMHGNVTTTLSKTGTGSLVLAGTVAFAGATAVEGGTLRTQAGGEIGPVRVDGGTFQSDGSAQAIGLNGGTLQGTGTVGAVTATAVGGTIAPGDSPGILNTGSVTLNSATTLAVELDGPTPGTYDQLNVTGAVALGSASLSVNLGFVPGANDVFTIINNDGTDPVSGIFAGLPQGSTFNAIAPNGASVQLVVSYSGGDGNDVTLSVNAPPVAGNDFFVTPTNTTLLVPAPGVLANDTDPNPGDQANLRPVLVTGPTHGSLALSNDGSFTYTPATGYSGPDSFTYRASDGRLSSNLATVSLFVNATNLPPTANPDSYSAQENQTLAIPAAGVLSNDFSPENLALTAVVQSSTQHGSLTLNADGSFTYTPAANYVGPDQFTYVAKDSNGLFSAATTVTLNVGVTNVPPVAFDDTFTLTENKALFVVGPGVLANDTDANKDSLTAFLVSAPVHGTLTLSGDGSINYTPDPNFSGTDSFTYRASDGQSTSNLATVTLNVVPVTQAPIGRDDTYVVNQGQSLTVPTLGVLANDTDPQALPLSAVLVNGPLHGTLTGGLNADGSFTYTPDPAYFGSDSFSYRAFNGTLSSDITTVNLSIAHVNHPPVAVNDAFTTNGNSTLSVAGPGVLANDTDPDAGDILSAVLATGPTQGTLALNSDGSFVYTPAFVQGGGGTITDSFTYFASDGKLESLTPATVTITIRPIPAPTAVNDTFTTNENSTLSVAGTGVLQNDTDPNGLPLASVLQSGPAHGSLTLNTDGSFTYVPAANYSGTDSFTYRVNDGKALGNIATASLNVLFVNLPPTAQNDSYTVTSGLGLFVPAPGVLGNDSDPQGLPLTAVLVNPPLDGSFSLQPSGAFSYIANPGFSGTDTFTYRASNGTHGSNLATVTIVVAAAPPTTVRLDPASDSGYSSTDRITNVRAPRFLGQAPPNLRVALFVTPQGQATATPTLVGSTTTDSLGNYAVTSNPLADGHYEFSVQTVRADGIGTGVIDAGPLLIDTVSPVITGVVIIPRTGQVQVTYLDPGVGAALGGPSETDPGNYVFTRRKTSTPRADVITSATLLPNGGPTGPQTVLLRVGKGGRIRHGYYLFRVISGGVADAAGNPLAGTFSGSYPTGNGKGGDYDALVRNGGFKNNLPVPTSHFIPVVTSKAAHPRGPHAHVTMFGKGR